ncbi:putative glycolipid-binding domain-containing protein [Actinacidiphila yeochonensis]|uniref:putative glycolipid-binding domain-containing protein n=1 Tax=Actinacidiphila yeochonensis TaxID=89050 RepID=UPI0005674651|nr:putative glycolipid-binding domain-containing protein [Actinacidiphila yeochonensis]
MLTWRIPESDGFETAWAQWNGGGLRARGRVVGTRPEPYWLDYELVTAADWTTRRLRVSAETAGGVRALDLRRHDDGDWSVDGVPAPELAGALDCDLGLSALTNTLPVRRRGLHRVPGERSFTMAMVRVPDLAVVPSVQTYTHLGPGRVRYASGSFHADLTVDADALVLEYPGMARRLERREVPPTPA